LTAKGKHDKAIQEVRTLKETLDKKREHVAAQDALVNQKVKEIVDLHAKKAIADVSVWTCHSHTAK
jgi:nitrogen regulatory protein PII